MSKDLKVLDLFCCQGGASEGYRQAGYTPTGVDKDPQKHYPFKFYQSDALVFLADLIENGEIEQFDLIHASPPCQDFSKLKGLIAKKHGNLIEPIRELLIVSDRDYVIENVPFSPLINPITLCGTMFGLQVIRHRWFETKPVLWFPPAQCKHIGKASSTRINGERKKETLENYEHITVVGKGFIVKDARIAMGISWMTGAGLSQAIPPAYTKWIGEEIKNIRKENVNASINPMRAI